MGDMNTITLFLNLGMQGLGTKTFHGVPLTETVSELLLRIADQEGALGCDWIRSSVGKVLTGAKSGKFVIGSDLGFYNEMTLWGSLRLKGGAEAKSQFDDQKVKNFGGSVAMQSCVLCMLNGKNAKMPCGCVYCTSCMNRVIERASKQECASEISCVLCKASINSVLAYEVAVYSNVQKAAVDQLLFRNGLKQPDSDISECASCKNLIMRQGQNGNKLQCMACKKHTCQICKLLWINANADNKTFCGNSVCDPSGMYQTFLDHAEIKDIYGVKVTNTRFCPKCLRVNIHGEACRHIKCHCKHEYCHICLQDYGSHQEELCKVAEQQKITKEMIIKLTDGC
mmetsp:Transcript_13638/g.21437  ORF Transcript_13638/g.21437 Transcript_13638/m.21437 type:complete len:340 (-) Transcript_13638:205-1224(-)